MPSVAWVTVEEAKLRAPMAPAVTDDVVALAVAQASEFLTGLSGISPTTTTTVVPRGCPCGTVATGPYTDSSGSPFYWRVGTIDGGDLVVGDECCDHQLLLPDNPVIQVTSVRVGGVVQDQASYELVDGYRLRRVPGSTWAGGQVQVTYTHGNLIGEAAKKAVSELARELAKAMTVGQRCSIPERVTSVTRDGTTFAMLDPQTFLDHGRTGLYWVDLFLAAVTRRPQSVSVTSPDSPAYTRLRS